ncbi:MAG TPA: PilZ domain-containing protein [Chitinivibrionales bacterium]
MSEKRKYRRRSLLYNLQVVDIRSGEAIGHVANLSPEGLMLVTGKRHEQGETVKLSIALPEKIFERDRIECEAQCMWCRVSENTDNFDVGLQLLEISQQDIEAIVALITKYRLLD